MIKCQTVDRQFFTLTSVPPGHLAPKYNYSLTVKLFHQCGDGSEAEIPENVSPFLLRTFLLGVPED